MQGLAEGSLPASLKLAKHLDNCLQCGSCTAVCPADVQYDTLLSKTHQEVPLSISPRINRMGRMANAIVKSPTRVRWAARLLWLMQKTKMLKLLGLKTLHEKIPKIDIKSNPIKQTVSTTGKRIVLLTGCLGNALDAKTICDAVFVFNKLGYEVSIPEKQSCCGSIAYHHGLFTQADTLLEEQAHLAGDPDTLAIISLASGCSAHLYAMQKTKQHPWLQQVQDIHDFLENIDFTQFDLQPIEDELQLHIPCTAKNQLRQQEKLLRIYQAIPGLNIKVIAAPTRCCGAAGLYMLEHPQAANKLGHEVLSAAEQGTIASPNIGCRIHLQSLQPERCLLHPISLLASSLGLLKQ